MENLRTFLQYTFWDVMGSVTPTHRRRFTELEMSNFLYFMSLIIHVSSSHCQCAVTVSGEMRRWVRGFTTLPHMPKMKSLTLYTHGCPRARLKDYSSPSCLWNCQNKLGEIIMNCAVSWADHRNTCLMFLVQLGWDYPLTRSSWPNDIVSHETYNLTIYPSSLL